MQLTEPNTHLGIRLAAKPPLRSSGGWQFEWIDAAETTLLENWDGEPIGIDVKVLSPGAYFEPDEARARKICAALGVEFPND